MYVLKNMIFRTNYLGTYYSNSTRVKIAFLCVLFHNSIYNLYHEAK